MSVAGDKQVRVFEAAVALAHSQSEPETTYSANQLDCRVLRCHTNRVKRIVTEDSPDLFLTVAEVNKFIEHILILILIPRIRTAPSGSTTYVSRILVGLEDHVQHL